MPKSMRNWVSKVSSLALAGLTLTISYRRLPMTIEWDAYAPMLNVAVIVWPLVLLPWLVGLTRKRQFLLCSVGVVAGYWLMGRPLFGKLHGMPLPNLDVLPRVLVAIPIGLALLAALEHTAWARYLQSILLASSLIGVALLFVAVSPINSALRLGQGQVKSGPANLRVAEYYELSTDIITAYTYEDVLVAIGNSEWLWRDPLGQVQMRPGTYTPWYIKVHCDGTRLYIVEQKLGRLECYSYPDGQLLWVKDGLGVVIDSAWTHDYVWVLNAPDLEGTWPWPEEMQVTLHQLSLNDGQGTSIEVKPPDTRFWKRVMNGPLAYLEATSEQAWVAGWSSREKPTYISSNHFEYSEADQPFIFRPVQGELEELCLSIPDGLALHPDMRGELSYYLSDDLLIDVTNNSTYTEYIARARSLTTGELVWQHPGLARPSLRSAWQKVLVSSTQGLLCLNESNGNEAWHYPSSASLRWSYLLEQDLLFGLANGTIVRMQPDGKPVWQHHAHGLASLEKVDATAGTLTIKDSGLKDGEGIIFTTHGIGVTLSLADGSVLPTDSPRFENSNYAVYGEHLWYMKEFSYRPSPYNGDRAVYRLAGPRVPVRDLAMQRDDMLVRPDYLLVAEQVGGKARLVILVSTP